MFLTARRFMYQQVYFHRTVRAIDLDLAEVFGPSIRAIFGDGSPADRLAAYADLDEYALLHQAARWARGVDVVADDAAAGARRRARPRAIADALAGDPPPPADLARRGRGPRRVRGRRPARRARRDTRRAGPGPDRRSTWRSSTPGPPTPAPTDRLLALEGRDGSSAVAVGGARVDPGVLADRPALPAPRGRAEPGTGGARPRPREALGRR